MKILKIIGGIFLFLIVLGVFGAATNPKKLDVKKSVEQGYKKTEEIIKKEENKNKEVAPTAKSIKKTAVLSGKDESGKVVVQDIAIWGKAGSGTNNWWNGTVPDNTEVEVLESKKAEGVVFYRIKSSVGKVDVLPTDLGAREKAMAKLPKSEWTVEADPSFPVDGWVTEDFVTNLK